MISPGGGAAKRKSPVLICDDLLELPGLRVKSGGTGDILDSEKNSAFLKEHQKILNLLHDLSMTSVSMHKSHLAKMVETVTQFGSCLTSLVEMMLSSKVEVIVSSLKDPSLAQ